MLSEIQNQCLNAAEASTQKQGQQLPAFLMNLPTPNRNRQLERPVQTSPTVKETPQTADPPVLPTPLKSQEATPKNTQLPSFLLNVPTPNRNCQVVVEQDSAIKSKTPLLPPVASVRKMAAKGCAIVILRDQKVMELAVAMKVAVVDGICIEVRRHVRRSKSDDEQELGVFCAWGFRVERRMPVSEEGLEAYFNGLSKVAEPQGLEVKVPFAEELQYFELSSSAPLKLDKETVSDSAEAFQMLDGPHGRPDLVNNLWEAKRNLEALWDRPPPPMGRSLMQRVAREQLFPHSGKEGNEHENRAGEKLEELATAVGLLDDVQRGSAFLDLCGGPGAWSQFLLAKTELSMRGFGFTLRSNSGQDNDWQAQEKDDWYPDLMQSRSWTALWGKDGTGDLLKPQNLEHCTRELTKKGGVFLCVADGGFSDKAIPPNLLELYFYRLFLAELLTAASCLQPGGRFVCKLYTACSAATSSLLFLTTRLFDHVAIVKPMTSRVAGPERYLYASGFHEGAETAQIREALSRSQAIGGGASPLDLPLLTPIVSPNELYRDPFFVEQLRAMVSRLCERQAGSLQAIVDRAGYLEDIALEAADEAEEGAKCWELAAAKQREEAIAARVAREEQENATPSNFQYSEENTYRKSGRERRGNHPTHHNSNALQWGRQEQPLQWGRQEQTSQWGRQDINRQKRAQSGYGAWQ